MVKLYQTGLYFYMISMEKLLTILEVIYVIITCIWLFIYKVINFPFLDMF